MEAEQTPKNGEQIRWPLPESKFRMKTRMLCAAAVVVLIQGHAQTILFDLDNAPIHASLPVSLDAGGITATFSATGQGFSIQPAGTQGFTPLGFSGLCIYPNSVYAADLAVSFSTPLTDFSILYAPQELACDSSATMRVTAYLEASLVGAATTNAPAGTWPSETLRFASTHTFNRVVIHYDKPPVTGGDWGPIFMADNISVILAPPPITLSTPTLLTNRTFQVVFTHTPGATLSLLASTNVAAPLATWIVLGSTAETSPGQYQFTVIAANDTRRFYCVRVP